MRNLSKDTKMVIAIVAMVLFAGYYFLLKPQSTALAEARLNRAAIEQQVADAELLLRGAAAETSAAGADSEVVMPDVAAVEVPSGAEIPGVLRSLQAIATATGMVHSSISPSVLAVNPAGPGGSIQISIAATGTRDGARSYVQQLGELSRLVLIERVGMQGQPDGSAAQLQLTISVFSTSPMAVSSS